MPDGFEGIQDHSRKVQELAVAAFYREFLEQRGIPPELAELAHLRVDVANNLNRILEEDTPAGKKHPWLAPGEYGVYVPTTDFNGDPIKGVYCVRRSGAELPKYLAPGGSRGVYAYLPPTFDWNVVARDPKWKLVIVEGPLKALSILPYLPKDVAIVAISGVTMFNVASNATQVPRLLEKFAWAGRDVGVLFDNDIKPAAVMNVGRARDKIVDILLQLHANAFVINFPNETSDKLGPDDFLQAGGAWDDMEWVPQDIKDNPLRLLRAQTMIMTNPLGAVDLETGQVMKYGEWKTRHLNKFVMKPKADRPTESFKLMATDYVWNDPHREEVTNVDFQPSKPPMTVYESGGLRVLNVWRGWHVFSQGSNPVAWEKFLRFLRHVIPNEDEAKWFLQFMAHSLQKPEERPQHMVVLVSVMTGTGKSTLARVWTEILGRYGCKVRPSDFFSGFNMFLYQNIGLWVDELKDGEHKQSQVVELLKDMVTTPRALCNEKHAPAFQVSLFNRIVATTNDLGALKAGPTERRLCMIGCVEKSVEHFPEIKALAVWLNTRMTEEDRQAIFDGLMETDLTGYDPAQRCLETVALEQAKEYTKWNIEAASDKVLEHLLGLVNGEDGVWIANDCLRSVYLMEGEYEAREYDSLTKALVTRARELGYAATSEIAKSGGKSARGQWVSDKGVQFKATKNQLRIDGGGKKYS